MFDYAKTRTPVLDQDRSYKKASIQSHENHFERSPKMTVPKPTSPWSFTENKGQLKKNMSCSSEKN